jgi:glutaredoxin
MILRAFFAFLLAAALPAQAQQQPFELTQLQKDFPVTLYTAPSCKEACELSRGVLNKRGIPFTEIQVWNAETLDELKKVAGVNTVPVLIVGRSVQSGFDAGLFDAALDSAGYPAPGTFAPRSQAQPPAPEGYNPPQTIKPATTAQTTKPGPYDSSGLTGPAPKPGIYDPSGLKGPPPKPGRYGTPPETQ